MSSGLAPATESLFHPPIPIADIVPPGTPRDFPARDSATSSARKDPAVEIRSAGICRLRDTRYDWQARFATWHYEWERRGHHQEYGSTT
jgi:hypothetical protein